VRLDGGAGLPDQLKDAKSVGKKHSRMEMLAGSACRAA
jgi:hypothetical protein